MRLNINRRGLVNGVLARAVAIAVLCVMSGAPIHAARTAGSRLFTFELDGGFFFGPGPVQPDTPLPHGRLNNIRFDPTLLRGQCEFANDGTAAGLLSDKRTRVNQNIEAGRLLIGGGVSPVMLTAVDGGPHQGTEQYYLDEHYRLVWRVDIALDPGFEEGIIRLNDFVLHTGVARVARSLQSQHGIPGGYDQAGSLPSGEYLIGRVGDFDHDGLLDGIVIAAPNVPLEADMLPGAPVGNRRGFRTDVPIAPLVSAELMMHGAMQLEEPLRTTQGEMDHRSYDALRADLSERLKAIRSRLQYAQQQPQWSKLKSAPPLPSIVQAVEGLSDRLANEPSIPLDGLFAELRRVLASLERLNKRDGISLSGSRMMNLPSV